MESHPLRDALQILLASKQTAKPLLIEAVAASQHDEVANDVIRASSVLYEKGDSLSHEQQEQQEQEQLSELEVCSPCSKGGVRYVGVDKVPGHTRWPYRAVMSLPACGGLTGEATRDGGSVVVCESYHSTAEAAARAVDAVCIALLGRDAAVNFPASSYDASDLADALRYIKCISGSGAAGAGGGGAPAFAAESTCRQPGPAGPCSYESAAAGASAAAKESSKGVVLNVDVMSRRRRHSSSSSSSESSSTTPLCCDA